MSVGCWRRVRGPAGRRDSRKYPSAPPRASLAGQAAARRPSGSSQVADRAESPSSRPFGSSAPPTRTSSAGMADPALASRPPLSLRQIQPIGRTGRALADDGRGGEDDHLAPDGQEPGTGRLALGGGQRAIRRRARQRPADLLRRELATVAPPGVQDVPVGVGPPCAVHVGEGGGPFGQAFGGEAGGRLLAAGKCPTHRQEAILLRSQAPRGDALGTVALLLELGRLLVACARLENVEVQQVGSPGSGHRDDQQHDR